MIDTIKGWLDKVFYFNRSQDVVMVIFAIWVIKMVLGGFAVFSMLFHHKIIEIAIMWAVMRMVYGLIRNK